jgi:hypothetical protein
MLNLQMIAFCPAIANCGIKDGGRKIVLTEDNTDP